MVVLIIGTSVLAFAPGISRAMSDRRVSMAARELIRIGRRARADSIGYLRAHLLYISPGTSTVQLLRGPTNSCRFAEWNRIHEDCAAKRPRCVENMSFASSTFSAGGEHIGVREQGATDTEFSRTARALCYQPNGTVLHSRAALASVNRDLSESNAGVNGGFVYAIYNGSDDPTPAMRVHRVLFPLGGSARSWQ